MHRELGCVGATAVLQLLERGGAEASSPGTYTLIVRLDEHSISDEVGIRGIVLTRLQSP
jgi:hypothetical protein